MTINNKHQNILISAGGTGGHIFPGLAIAKALQPEYNVLWVGGSIGLETTLVVQNNIELHTIDMYGLRGKGIRRYLLMPFILSKSCVQTWRIFNKKKPNIVITFGGYVTFPVALIAYIKRVPLVIHEQNSVAGLANKLIAKFATQVLVAFPNVLKQHNAKLVGNPIRSELRNLADPKIRYAKRSGGLNILVMGGSLGARGFNELLPQVLSKLPNIATITHQVGRGDRLQVVNSYQSSKAQVTVVNFIEDMTSIYNNVDLVICRAGASTIAEICSIGVASILVPYPYATDNHQQVNATGLVNNNATHMVLQSPNLANDIHDILLTLSRESCLTMASNAYNLAIPDTIERICAIIKDNIKLTRAI